MSDSEKQSQKFPGFKSPNTTPVPDQFFDEVLDDLSGAETKVALYIVRRTFGFKKERDNISLSQMVNGITTHAGKILDRGTGLGKASVIRACKTLEAKGVIVRTRRQSEEKGYEATTYTLNIIGGEHDDSAKAVTGDDNGGGTNGENKAPLSQNDTSLVSKRDTPLSQNDTYNKQLDNKQLDNQTVNSSKKNQIKSLPPLDRPKDEIDHIATMITSRLGEQDAHSARNHWIIASRIPKSIIEKHLDDLEKTRNLDGALFQHRMNAETQNMIDKGKVERLTSTAALAERMSIPHDTET